MDLFLFIIILIISLVLITLGLLIREHTELSIIGFAILFMLAMVLISSDIQHKVGENSSQQYIWGCDNFTTNQTIIYIMGASEAKTDIYETYTGGILSHQVGYWLAIAAVVGFIGIVISLRRQWGRQNE